MKPIAPDLFLDGPIPCLVGGRHVDDGRIVFPMPTGGEAAQYQIYPLKPRGTLWSWTVQRFPPKSPPYAGATFSPYVVGYVELEDQVIVEGRLIDVAVEDVSIGMHLQTTVMTYDLIDGDTVNIYAFKPVQEA